MKLNTFLLLIICSLPNVLNAQVTYANPEDFNIIKGRPLIVELLELDEKQIEDWNKKKEKAKKPELSKKYNQMIEEYSSFVTDYNNYIKATVEEYWDLNKQIEYKTTSEVKNLRKSSKKYAVLWFSESRTQATDDFGFKYFPNLTIPTLNYSRIEKGTAKVDYSYFMSYTGNRKINEIKQCDLILSLKVMKHHIQEIEKSGNNKYTFKSYADKEEKENCKNLSGKKIGVNESLIHEKASFAEMKTLLKPSVLLKLSDEDICSAIENEEDIIIGFSIPHQIAAGSVGPLSAARILYFKSFINVNTGKVYSCYGISTGEFNDFYFRNSEFKKISRCK